VTSICIPLSIARSTAVASRVARHRQHDAIAAAKVSSMAYVRLVLRKDQRAGSKDGAGSDDQE
jgi:hypothetical protein